jgi:hypothetical protein
MPIATEASSAMVGPVILHLECWITRVQDRLRRYNPTGSPLS